MQNDKPDLIPKEYLESFKSMSILITHVFVPQFIFATTNSCSDVKGTTGGVLIAYLDPNSESKVHIE